MVKKLLLSGNKCMKEMHFRQAEELYLKAY